MWKGGESSVKTMPFAIEQGGERRFEIDLALDISAFCVLNGLIIFWAVLSPGLHPLREHADLVLWSNLAMAVLMTLPCLKLSALFRGAVAGQLVIVLAWTCIAVATPHLAERLSGDLPALFLTAVALAGLTYVVAALLALTSFEGEATIRIG